MKIEDFKEVRVLIRCHHQKNCLKVDGYSENPPILCEIYLRIGKMKVRQHNKIGKDILKMLLIEKIQNKTFRKIIAFAYKK